MKVGTKSLLFGAHNIFIHPFLVFIAWWRLYGFPADPRLWVAFIVHDWGYLGKPNMDGPEGETHVELGARIMRIFGRRWEEFTRHHSREWFYLFRTRITGELKEYMALSANGKYSCKEYMNRSIETPQSWYRAVKSFTLRYVAQNYRYGHR